MTSCSNSRYRCEGVATPEITVQEMREFVGFSPTCGKDKSCVNPHCTGEDYASRCRRALSYPMCWGCLK